MSNHKVPISVTMITYNHEKYIAESIQSVLEQTFADFELIVVNDGSTDRTDEIIRTFQDPRITYIYQENQGPSVAINNAILAAQGKYVALMSGDDVCYPQRLEKQYLYAKKEQKSILFSWVDFIDDDSRPSIKNYLPKSYFNLGNKSRSEILSHFFFQGNYLCAPTAFIEKKLLLDAELFCTTSIQLQDFDMWIKLLPEGEFFLSTEKLLKYRRRKHGFNLSNKRNLLRSNFEASQIYRHIFNNIDSSLFKEAFYDFLFRKDFDGKHEYEIEKSFLYFNHNLPFIREIGVERLFKLLQNKETLMIAIEKYDFGLPRLYEFMQDEKKIDKNRLLKFRHLIDKKYMRIFSLV
ncbi:glycosyltransferase family 2 protein [Synechocystis sp. LEGE 06083]|uniref:glycosyltransferase family 2 protein n=1 Tax=Synechocystis sp. LEGE 06083 TaxID=915336 RepID=UPI0018810520|nr:glycosyltransferase family 2 protein [Synechocystis sp. LEGE 06083]MBE9196307.1 glycosyltransferase family 2 protein [Synechocystis sp. LEGE 06083]